MFSKERRELVGRVLAGAGHVCRMSSGPRPQSTGASVLLLVIAEPYPRPVATIRDWTDPFVREYVPVPPVGDEVCEVCHGACQLVYDTCWNCRESCGGVSFPQELVVPITLYKSYSQLGHVMRAYKDSPDERIRRPFGLQLGALAGRFLDAHRGCIVDAAGQEWDTVTVVPSTRTTADEATRLEEVLCLVPSIGSEFRRLVRSNGTPVGRSAPDEFAFDVRPEASGSRVLLVDDTFTTGAHLQSVTSALARAGATVVACVVLGRVIDPTFSDEAGDLWERQTNIPFDFDDCCLE